MDGTGDLFAPLLAHLSSDIPAVVVRYPDKPLDYAAHEAVARAALPIDRSYVLLGESFSGPVAISIAARAPAGLLGYILCASFVRCPRSVLRLLKPLLGLVPPQRVPDEVGSFFLMGRFATPDLRRMHAQVLRRVSPATLVARLKAIADVDVSAMLGRIRVPALYLRATEDRLIPGSAAATFTRLAPNARVAEIEGPHFLLQASPVAAARAIRDFIREVA